MTNAMTKKKPMILGKTVETLIEIQRAVSEENEVTVIALFRHFNRLQFRRN